MDTSNQPNQQTPSPQYQQNIIIVGKQKSAGIAFILAFFFGPLGLLYASVTGGIVMFILGVIISIVTLGLGLIVVWIACIIWAVVAANNANSKISSAASVNINVAASSPQQPVYQTPQQQPAIEPIPQQPVQPQPTPVSTNPEYIEAGIPEASKQKAQNDLSLNNFGDWVTDNKKGLMFGLGGVVIILVLIVAIKYVVSVNFSKAKQDITTAKNSLDSANIGGDANAPIPASPNSGSSNNTPTAYYGLYPQSSVRLLTLSDLTNLNKRDLKIMRNEIFARHGYIFKTPEMKSYFAMQRWYKPLYDNVDNQLSSTEKANVELIKSNEK